MREFSHAESITQRECQSPSLGVSQSVKRELWQRKPELPTDWHVCPIPSHHRRDAIEQLKAFVWSIQIGLDV
jgi:hypothetical protein